QPKSDPAPVAGCGYAAGVEKPRWHASFAPLFPAHPPGGSESALPKSNLNVPREILGETTKPNMPLVVPEISYLHHGLLVWCPTNNWIKSQICFIMKHAPFQFSAPDIRRAADADRALAGGHGHAPAG